MVLKHLRALVAFTATLLVSTAIHADYTSTSCRRSPRSRATSTRCTSASCGCAWRSFFVVFGAMFWSIFKHRRRQGPQGRSVPREHDDRSDLTIVPFIILIGMAYPATRTVLEMKDASNADISVKVTGYQWKWEYDYQQDGIKFLSNLATRATRSRSATGKVGAPRTRTTSSRWITAGGPGREEGASSSPPTT